MNLVIKTCLDLSKPIMNRFFFIYLVFYEFAYFGQLFFGGSLTMEAFNKQN